MCKIIPHNIHTVEETLHDAQDGRCRSRGLVKVKRNEKSKELQWASWKTESKGMNGGPTHGAAKITKNVWLQFWGLYHLREVHQTQQNFWFCHRILGTLLWTKDTIQGYLVPIV